MNANYSRETIIQGRYNQNRGKETPNSFAIENGAAKVNETNNMDAGDTRMAGVEGQRAQTMMNNPEEMDRTMKWMEAFGLSNQGAEFNMAKMNGGVPPMQ